MPPLWREGLRGQKKLLLRKEGLRLCHVEKRPLFRGTQNRLYPENCRRAACGRQGEGQKAVFPENG